MAIIHDPDVSEIEEGIKFEDICEAVRDPNRYEFKNSTGSFTIIGATDNDQPEIITAVIKRDSNGGDWKVLQAHKAKEEEAKAREENIGRTQ